MIGIGLMRLYWEGGAGGVPPGGPGDAGEYIVRARRAIGR
jgi:hypothetical protein